MLLSPARLPWPTSLRKSSFFSTVSGRFRSSSLIPSLFLHGGRPSWWTEFQSLLAIASRRSSAIAPRASLVTAPHRSLAIAPRGSLVTAPQGSTATVDRGARSIAARETRSLASSGWLRASRPCPRQRPRRILRRLRPSRNRRPSSSPDGASTCASRPCSSSPSPPPWTRRRSRWP